MRILVTGGAGYIGSVVVRQLLQNGQSISVFDNLSFGGETLIDLFHFNKFRFIYGDIRNKNQVKSALKNIDCVVHLAAIVGDPACKLNPKLANEVNFQGSKILCDLAKASHIKRYIHISTCSNYGISDQSSPATEDSELHPISLYAETKIAAEQYLLRQINQNFTACILRLSTVFGLSPRMRFDLLVNEIIRDAYLHKKVVLYHPLAWRPFLHISDVSRVITTCLTANKRKIHGQIFNVGYDNYQKREIINTVRNFIPECKEEVRNTIGDQRNYCVSFKKIQKVLHFQTKTKLRDGIKEIYDALSVGIFKSPEHYRYTNIGWPTI